MFFVNGVRNEGWAFYLEEMILQAGLLDDRRSDTAPAICERAAE